MEVHVGAEVAIKSDDTAGIELQDIKDQTTKSSTKQESF